MFGIDFRKASRLTQRYTPTWTGSLILRTNAHHRQAHSHIQVAPSIPKLAGLTVNHSTCLTALVSTYNIPRSWATDGITEGPHAQLSRAPS